MFNKLLFVIFLFGGERVNNIILWLLKSVKSDNKCFDERGYGGEGRNGWMDRQTDW